jgi:hypothetical protein
MELLLRIHSIVRWLVILLALIALFVNALIWSRRIPATQQRWLTMTSFVGLVDTQVLLGIILLFWYGIAGSGFPRYQIEHGVIMLVAAGVAHLNVRWRKSDDVTRARNNVLDIIAVLVIVFVGISRLPGGLSR